MPEFPVYLRSLIKDIDFFKSDMDSETSLKFCTDLLKVLYISNKKLARQLLEHNYGDNSLQLCNWILGCDSSLQVTNVRMNGIVEILLHYFSAGGKLPENNIVRNAIKQTSIASLMNVMRFRVLCNSFQEVDLKDKGADFIPKCFKNLAEIYFTSEFKMFNCTEKNMHQNFKVLKTVVPVLVEDDTINVSIDDKYENNAYEIADKTEIILSNSRSVEAEVHTDSDTSSSSDSNEEPNVKIALYNYHYDDNSRRYRVLKTTADDSDGDSNENVRLRDAGIGWKYKRMPSINYDDDSDSYQDDVIKSGISRYFIYDGDAISLVPNRELYQSMESSLCNQGFVNPCFEDDSSIGDFSYIKMVNDHWKDTMDGVPEQPKEFTKVSFVSSPDLVTVRHFDREDDGNTYSTNVINQMRFRCRILDFENIMAPFMTLDHREHIYQRNNSSIC